MKKSAHSKFSWTEEVKRQLGASFVSWENNKGEYRLLIGFGDKNKMSIPIKGTPLDTKVEHYIELIKTLKEAGHGEI